MSEAIPQSDKALLEAQAQAGQAGVKAYQAAKAELEARNSSSAIAAAQAASGRRAPDAARRAVAQQGTDRRAGYNESLAQRESAARQRAYDRAQREAAYGRAVQGARGLIADQAQAVRDEINVRSDANIASLRAQSEGNVNRIEAQMELDMSRLEAEQRLRDQAAAQEQARWEREMAARERAAARAGGGGGGAGRRLSDSELRNALAAGGVERLKGVNAVLGGALDNADASVIESALRAITTGAAYSSAAPRTVASSLFREFIGPNFGWEDINRIQDRWQENGISDTDIARLARMRREQDADASGLSGPAKYGNVDSHERYVTRIQTEITRMLAEMERKAADRTARGTRRLRQAGIFVNDDDFGSIGPSAMFDTSTPTARPVTNDPWGLTGMRSVWGSMGMAGSDLAAEHLIPYTSRREVEADPGLAAFVQLANEAGIPINQSGQVSSLFGLRNPGQYEYDTSISDAQNMALMQAYNRANPGDYSIAADALQEATAQMDPSMLQGYNIDPAEIVNAQMQNAGLTAFDAMGGDGTGQSLADIVNQRRSAFDEAQRRAGDQAYTDHQRRRTLEQQARDDYFNFNDDLAFADQAARFGIDASSPTARADLEQAVDTAQRRGRDAWLGVVGENNMNRYGIPEEEAEQFLTTTFPFTTEDGEQEVAVGDLIRAVLDDMRGEDPATAQTKLYDEWGLDETSPGVYGLVFNIIWDQLNSAVNLQQMGLGLELLGEINGG